MPLNDLRNPQHWSKPRAQLQVKGGPVFALAEVEVTSNNYYAADSFHCRIPIGALPDAYGLAWWGDQTSIDVDVLFGSVPTGGNEGDAVFQSMLSGRVDSIQVDMVAGILAIDGRDHTADLIDTKTQETFANRTASEVAAVIAGRHGLGAEVTATSTLVGSYYQLEHDGASMDEFAKATTEWDLLTYLAKQEGFDCYVSGKTLYFQPRTDPLTSDPYVVNWIPIPKTMNALGLQMSRALTLARDVEVTVKTWNSKQKKAIVRTVKSSAGGKSTGDPQQYVFVRPNLTPDQALKFASAQIAEISKHERVISFEIPGDLVLTPRNILQIRGTQTSWDQRYYVDEVVRNLSFDGEFTMLVRGKNHSTVSETVVR